MVDSEIETIFSNVMMDEQPDISNLSTPNITANITNTSGRDENLALIEILTLSTIFVLIIFGNVCVLISLAMIRFKMSRMYYFLLHLCISDLITAIFTVLPQLAWDITYRFHGNNFLCKLVKCMQIFGPYLSSYVLVMTAIDRYQAVCHPLSSRTWTPRHSKLMISFSWTVSILCSIPQAFIFSYQAVPGALGSEVVYDCWGTFPAGGERIYVTWYATSVFFIPLIIITYAYVRICLEVWINVHRKRHNTNGLAVEMNKMRKQKKQQQKKSSENEKNANSKKKKNKVVKYRLIFTRKGKEKEEQKKDLASEENEDLERNERNKSHKRQSQENEEEKMIQLLSSHSSSSSLEERKAMEAMKCHENQLGLLSTGKSKQQRDECNANNCANNADADGQVGSKLNSHARTNQTTSYHHHHHHNSSQSPGRKKSVKGNSLAFANANANANTNANQVITSTSTSTTTTANMNPHCHSIYQISRAKIKTVKVTVVVVICYIICSSPFILVQMWAYWYPGATQTSFWNSSLIVILMLLSSLNSCVNPWIYLFFNPNLMKALKDFCSCRKRDKLKTNFNYSHRSRKDSGASKYHSTVETIEIVENNENEAAV